MQVDNLQWEVNRSRLEAENKSLRVQDTEASKRVDLEIEGLNRSRRNRKVFSRNRKVFMRNRKVFKRNWQ